MMTESTVKTPGEFTPAGYVFTLQRHETCKTSPGVVVVPSSWRRWLTLQDSSLCLEGEFDERAEVSLPISGRGGDSMYISSQIPVLGVPGP